MTHRDIITSCEEMEKRLDDMLNRFLQYIPFPEPRSGDLLRWLKPETAERLEAEWVTA